MSDFGNRLSLQVDALVTALRMQQETRCGQIVRQAETQAQAMLASSRRRLRDRVRLAVGEERKRRAVALHQARQRFQTANRRKIQAQYKEMLRRAWPLLVSVLESRWANSASRRQWCDLLLHEACSAMSPENWVIEHPPAWDAGDAGRLTGLLGERGVPEPDYRVDETIRGGLRIRHAGACLDGTIEGLLSKRIDVEAHLLAVWERESTPATESPGD